ncbi:MAG: hypothetical protein ACP5OA_02630 [Candidatus Woesearchaeota archaeon]
MWFAHIFDNNTTEKCSENAIKDVKEYMNQFLIKIDCMEYIILHLVNLKKSGFGKEDYLDMKTSYKISLGKHISEDNTKKINKKYFRLIKDRINRYDKSINVQIAASEDEKEKLLSIEKSVIEYIELKKEFEHINKVKQDMSLIKENLLKQQGLIDEINKDFNNIYKKAYTEEINSIEWNPNNLLILKELLRKEAEIILENPLSIHIAEWRAKISELTTSPQNRLFTDLSRINSLSRDIQKYKSEKHIKCYHAVFATNKKDIFPINETESNNGFYICIDNPQYSRAIKLNQDPSNLGKDIKVFGFSIPASLFRKMFISDSNPGPDKGSELITEAYNNSYYLPVPRYPLFNYYLYHKIINAI